MLLVLLVVPPGLQEQSAARARYDFNTDYLCHVLKCSHGRNIPGCQRLYTCMPANVLTYGTAKGLGEDGYGHIPRSIALPHSLTEGVFSTMPRELRSEYTGLNPYGDPAGCILWKAHGYRASLSYPDSSCIWMEQRHRQQMCCRARRILRRGYDGTKKQTPSYFGQHGESVCS